MILIEFRYMSNATVLLRNGNDKVALPPIVCPMSIFVTSVPMVCFILLGCNKAPFPNRGRSYLFKMRSGICNTIDTYELEKLIVCKRHYRNSI